MIGGNFKANPKPIFPGKANSLRASRREDFGGTRWKCSRATSSSWRRRAAAATARRRSRSRPRSEASEAGGTRAGRQQHAREDRADTDHVIEVQALVEEDDRV